MSSNEEYLDQLLKAVEEREPADHALTRLQEETSDDSSNYTSPQEEEDILAELLAAETGGNEEEISFENEDISESLLDELMEDMPETGADPAEGTSAETEEAPVAMEPEPMVPEELFSEAESASVQDVAAGEDESEDEYIMSEEDESEDEYVMSEEDIDALLSAAKESAEAELRENAQESKEMEDEGLIDDNLDDEDFSGLFEVDDLDMEDQQADLLDDPDNFDNYLVEEDLLEEELQLQEETAKQSRKEKKKDKKKERLASDKEDGEEKKGLFGKLVHFLMEEVEDPLEAEQTNLSEENKEILSQLDKEKEEKRKAAEEKKKLKKEEKEKKKQENQAKKEARQQARKEKKEQDKAAREEKEAALPAVKPLPKKKVMISFVFSFSLMAVILLAVFLLLPQIEIGEARGAYERGDYEAAYKAYYGNNLKEEDSNRFYAAETILRMERNLDAYHNYMEMQDVTQALHSLICGVVLRDEILRDAESYGVVSQVESTYSQIEQILNQDYNLTAEEAKSIAAEKSDVTYTKMLEAIAGGTEYVEESPESEESTAIPQEDLLPEEEELFLESEPSSEPQPAQDAGGTEEGGQIVVVGSEANL